MRQGTDNRERKQSTSKNVRRGSKQLNFVRQQCLTLRFPQGRRSVSARSLRLLSLTAAILGIPLGVALVRQTRYRSTQIRSRPVRQTLNYGRKLCHGVLVVQLHHRGDFLRGRPSFVESL